MRAATICFLFICFKALVILKTRKKNLRKKCSAAESEKKKKLPTPKITANEILKKKIQEKKIVIVLENTILLDILPPPFRVCTEKKIDFTGKNEIFFFLCETNIYILSCGGIYKENKFSDLLDGVAVILMSQFPRSYPPCNRRTPYLWIVGNF